MHKCDGAWVEPACFCLPSLVDSATRASSLPSTIPRYLAIRGRTRRCAFTMAEVHGPVIGYDQRGDVAVHGAAVAFLCTTSSTIAAGHRSCRSIYQSCAHDADIPHLLNLSSVPGALELVVVRWCFA